MLRPVTGLRKRRASLVLVGLSLPPRSIYPTRDFFAGASGRAHEQQQQCWFQTQTGARVVVRVRASGGPWTIQARRHVRSGQQSASASAWLGLSHCTCPCRCLLDRTGLGFFLWGLCQCQSRSRSRSGSLLCLLATAARPDRSPSGPPRFTRSLLSNPS